MSTYVFLWLYHTPVKSTVTVHFKITITTNIRRCYSQISLVRSKHSKMVGVHDTLIGVVGNMCWAYCGTHSPLHYS